MLLLLFNKLRRSFKSRTKRFKIKLEYIFFFRRPSNLNIGLFETSELSALPGSDSILEQLSEIDDIEISSIYYESVLNHKLKIFNDDLIDINNKIQNSDKKNNFYSKSINIFNG